jgi:purine-nucleoside phosphorylase
MLPHMSTDAAELPADPLALAGQAAEALRRRFAVESLDLAFVLGSGWSSAADDLGELVGSCALAELPGFAQPTVTGHGGELRVVRTPTGKTAAVLTGRTHYYEGRGVAQVVHGVRAVAAAGAGTLVLTNGCGGLHREWRPGTPVLIRDHINLTAATPLVGPRFLDMTDAYAPRLRDLARTVDAGLAEGVYVQFHGPNFETPAEVRMAGILGGDLVGMSTALETIAAREAGMEVLGISLVTNLAAGISPTPLHHAEVLEAGREAAPKLRSLLAGLAAVL